MSEPERGWVLDASALLAMLRGEPGGEKVPDLLQSAALSSVNWAEVIQKSIEHKVDVSGMREDFEALGLEIVPFTVDQAEQVAHLRQETRSLGLSLGDRACLALALERGCSAVTTDRSWTQLSLDVPIENLR
jgi:ribonuclease VapC